MVGKPPYPVTQRQTVYPIGPGQTENGHAARNFFQGGPDSAASFRPANCENQWRKNMIQTKEQLVDVSDVAKSMDNSAPKPS